jgi:CRP-like cAMP-binding protein
MEQIAALLRESPLFAGLEEKEIRRLVELSHLSRFQPGEVIVAQGSAGDSLFLLCEGALQVSAEGEKGRSIALATLDQPGAFFGEVSLVDHGPRSATVKAASSALVLKVSLEALERFFMEFEDTQVTVLRNLSKVLAQRLRHSNVVLSTISSSSSN